MGNKDGHSRNATSMTFLHDLRDLWKSPRGTVLRIEFLAGVAIFITFLLAAFGSSRRWSNRWIVQKGFFATHALALSVGTYSIGLMQTSPVKSEIYPIWTVSLFTLFGCIDPVTTYNGLDYKGTLSKVVFGICLHSAYVLLISNSAIFSDTGNTAVNVLAAITFFKSFHRSLALVQQSKMRKTLEDVRRESRNVGGLVFDDRGDLIVDFTPTIANKWREPPHSSERRRRSCICIRHVEGGLSDRKNEQWYQSCYHACVAFGLSHKLHRHLVGLDDSAKTLARVRSIDYTLALKVIEIELAFLYDIFFTGYPFLHYYQAKAASLWVLASLLGICFVGVATVTPRTMTSSHRPISPGGCTNVVDTTALDLVFTFGILVSIALLQLMQLIQGWTSNWARCAVALAYGMKDWEDCGFHRKRPFWWTWWMRLKTSVAMSTTWFNNYLWQEKIGQCSTLPRGRSLITPKKEGRRRRRILCEYINNIVYQLYLWLFAPLIKMLGVHYLWKVLWDLLGNDSNNGDTVELDGAVKDSIIEFLDQIKDHKLDGDWLLLPDDHPLLHFHLLYFNCDDGSGLQNQGYTYMSCVVTWHTATWYCEVVERKREEQEAETAAGERKRNQSKNRLIANVLSEYCIYLLESARELLPGPATDTRFYYRIFANTVKGLKDNKNCFVDPSYTSGMDIANHLLRDDPRRPDPWETLAVVWVRLLLYAAPYGNVEAHMRHLAQGGEFITHLWALLYHLDIRHWEHRPKDEVDNINIITTLKGAKKILTKDGLDIIVVGFIARPKRLQAYRWDFLTMSRLIDGVKFYLTSSPDVAKFLNFPASILQSSERNSFLVHNKVENKTAFFDFQADRVLEPDEVAIFVYETKLAWDKEGAQEGPSTSHSLIPIGKQGSEDEHTVVEIKEDVPMQPPLS